MVVIHRFDRTLKIRKTTVPDWSRWFLKRVAWSSPEDKKEQVSWKTPKIIVLQRHPDWAQILVPGLAQIQPCTDEALQAETVSQELSAVLQISWLGHTQFTDEFPTNQPFSDRLHVLTLRFRFYFSLPCIYAYQCVSDLFFLAMVLRKRCVCFYTVERVFNFSFRIYAKKVLPPKTSAF